MAKAYKVLGRNPATGNIRDTVSEAWAAFRDDATTLDDGAAFQQWHNTKAPAHPRCSMCR